MERMYPLAYLQHMSVCRAMEWDLSKSISGMSLSKWGANEAYAVSHGRDIFGLHPRLVRVEYPIGETPQLSATFINQFLKVREDFPTDFCLLGWVYSSDKSRWGEMVRFFLRELEDLLKQVGLYQAIRAVQYGISQSHHFYGILECYSPVTGTFFTLGKIGFALYELYEVSGLVIRDAPYEEYVPTTDELHLGKRTLRCTRPTGKCYATSIFVGK